MEKEGLFGTEKHRLISYMWFNVNYYKSVHHPIPICGDREHPGNFQNKSGSSPFN